LICGTLSKKDLVPYYNISFLDKRQSLGKVNDFSSINEETVPKVNKIFDLGSISTVFKNDIQTPKLVGNVTISEIFGLDEKDVSKECLDIIHSKYSCITLQNNDFNFQSTFWDRYPYGKVYHLHHPNSEQSATLRPIADGLFMITVNNPQIEDLLTEAQFEKTLELNAWEIVE